jgi:hypothetical protein
MVALATADGAACAGAPADHGTEVTGVLVSGGPPPKVAASYPADGASVPAGTMVLKITFDQPMTPDAWSYARAPDGAFPNCLEHPRLLGDRRTFVLLCAVNAHQSYAIQINAPRDFANDAGRTAKPTLLRFSTGDVGPRDLHEALKLSGLTEADDPIMTWKDPGAGVSQSARAADDASVDHR